MFSYIKGLLIASSPASIIVENSGIAYKIFIPVSAYHSLPPVGEAATLHTSFVVREISQTLFGFLSTHERDFFEVLMGVTGVGPKLALALIGHMPLAELQDAIVNEDSTALCRVPGIGKKGAQRLIIELRDKVQTIAAPAKHILHTTADPKVRTINDAMSALISLGYNQSVAQKAIKRSLDAFSESSESNEAPIDLSRLIATALTHV